MLLNKAAVSHGTTQKYHAYRHANNILFQFNHNNNTYIKYIYSLSFYCRTDSHTQKQQACHLGCVCVAESAHRFNLL